MEMKTTNWIGVGIGLVVVISSLFTMGSKFFFFLFGFGLIIIASPFVFTLIHENKVAAEKEEMFLEFARNLVESVKAGTPISKSIINIKSKSYGILSENVRKLANQISLGIPLGKALEIFAKDVNNKSITRTITLIGQAEKSGGDIGEVLEDVAGAVSMSDRLKKERVATISTLVAQGYIIFLIFIIIILIMQFKILPLISGIANLGATTAAGPINIGPGYSGGVDSQEVSTSFLYLLIIQGFFSGLTIGKLAEGNIKAGIKHSFMLVLLSFIIFAGANILFG